MSTLKQTLLKRRGKESEFEEEKRTNIIPTHTTPSYPSSKTIVKEYKSNAPYI